MVFDTKKYITLTYFKENLAGIFRNKTVWTSIIALGIFWAISQVVVAIFGEYIKTNLNITNTIVAQGLLASSGVGIIVGSVYISKISKYFIQIGIVPLGAIGIAVSLYILPSCDTIVGLAGVLLVFGFFAGVFIVPLNSLIQYHTDTKILGQVLSGNNFIQNIFMLVFLCISTLFGYLMLDSIWLFDFVFVVALIVAIYFVYSLSGEFARFVLKFLILLRYRVRVHNLPDDLSDTGILMLGNHISYLDWAVLQIAYPHNIIFVVDQEYYDKWYLKPVMKFFECIPISTHKSKAALCLIGKVIDSGKTVALFPEGGLSKTGELQRFKKGYEVACKDISNAKILPFFIDGLYQDRFSRASKEVRKIANTKVGIYFGEYLHIKTKAHEVRDEVQELLQIHTDPN